MNLSRGAESGMRPIETGADHFQSPETDSEHGEPNKNQSFNFLEIVRQHVQGARAEGRNLRDPEVARQLREKLQPFLEEGLRLLLEKMAEDAEDRVNRGPTLTPINYKTKLVVQDGWIQEVPANTKAEDLPEGATFWGQDARVN